MSCGGQCRFHGERYKDHEFTEPSTTTAPIVICDDNAIPHPLDQSCRNPVGQLAYQAVTDNHYPPSLITAAREVERWWLEQERSSGAPAAIFDLRAALVGYDKRLTQPALEAGEWHWAYDAATSHSGNYHVRAQGNGDCIAHTTTERDATQIVSDHNAVPRLEDALIQVRNNAQVFTGAQHLNTARQGLEEIVKQIDATLTTLRREG